MCIIRIWIAYSKIIMRGIIRRSCRPTAKALLKLVILFIVIATALLYIACLTYYNTSSVTSKDSTSKEHIRNHGNPGDDIRRLLDTIGRESVTDLSDTYRYTPNIVAPHSVVYLPNSTQVTLCTQASDNHLNVLHELVNMWKGPISFTVFTAFKRLPNVIYSIVRMRKCDDLVRKYVQFHVALPVVRTEYTLELIPDFDFNCTMMNELTNGNRPNFPVGSTYPGNMLRTVSLKYAETAYVMSLDIDLVPSKDLNAMLQVFLREDLELPSNASKMAYILPVFETNLKPVSPLSKQELLPLWPTKIRPYYSIVCPGCQKPTEYPSWVKLETKDRMEVAYTVIYQSVPWEPFYVARKSRLPLFDFQFKNFGSERDSQVCELHVAGYTFKVLNNGFVVHRGFKSMRNVGKTSWAENTRNHHLFEAVFYVEMKSRYPDSDRECMKKDQSKTGSKKVRK